MAAFRRVQQAAEEEATRLGLTLAWIQGGKHKAFVIEGHRFTISTTYQGDNQLDWVRQGVRRIHRKISCSMDKPSKQLEA